jgi:hypothetical protein
MKTEWEGCEDDLFLKNMVCIHTYFVCTELPRFHPTDETKVNTNFPSLNQSILFLVYGAMFRAYRQRLSATIMPPTNR